MVLRVYAGYKIGDMNEESTTGGMILDFSEQRSAETTTSCTIPLIQQDIDS